MRDLPSGTVTFLFTDVEGSTRLLQEHGAAYADLLDRHREALGAEAEGVWVRVRGSELTFDDAIALALTPRPSRTAPSEGKGKGSRRGR